MKVSFRGRWAFIIVAAAMVGGVRVARADVPPTPSGSHPRLFLNAKTLDAVTANAQMAGTAAANLVAGCQDTIDNAKSYAPRGGADANTWPHAAMECALGYLTTKKPEYLTQSIKYWTASLEDDQNLGDKLGCVAGVDTNWQDWASKGMTGSPPKVIITVTHDTGYPMRWYGPYVALTYDWLFSAPGVSDALKAQTRTCMQNWADYYTKYGYHHEEAGSNYNAGFVLGKTLMAIALGGEGGADADRLWTETNTDLFAGLLIGKGLAGGTTGAGTAAGVMLGGDWGEGWQYGPLSVFEYALATRAMEENGAVLPEMDAWTNSLILRYTYGTVPHLDGHLPGGDFENGDNIYAPPNSGIVGAVLAGPSSEQAAAWAKSMQVAQKLDKASKTPYIGDVLAELRTTAPQSYAMQTPAPPLWYLARGTRTLYVRSSWDQDAFWGAFDSAPQVNSDHHHFDASNFVFTHGGDHLVVDPSGYGCRSTLPTNALTADSPAVKGTYAPSQTPWSKAELAWARGTNSGVYAARGDFAQAFAFSSTPSDIPYAHREWVFLPEGEVVVIDRVHTADAAHNMYVSFHTNTAGTLKIDGAAVTGTVGTSTLAIHPVFLSGATPSIVKPGMDDNCFDGTCSNVRIPVDEYLLKVPGPWAVAVHVLDGLGATEAQATVSSMNDPAYDPGKANGGIVGAAVYRGSKQSYVVASSAMEGKAADTLSYAVPGASSGRHVVFDAPEDGDGKSQVTATVADDQCAVSITAGAGFAGHPLMFQVSTVADGCKATEDTDVPSSGPPPGGGVAPIGTGGGSTGTAGSSGNGASSGNGDSSGNGGSTGGSGPAETGGNSLVGGCGCVVSSSPRLPGSSLLVAGLGALVMARRRRR